jgi:hypothetical protein
MPVDGLCTDIVRNLYGNSQPERQLRAPLSEAMTEPLPVVVSEFGLRPRYLER